VSKCFVCLPSLTCLLPLAQSKAMVPFMDMMQHSFTPNARVDQTSDRTIRLHACTALAAGQEVTFSCKRVVQEGVSVLEGVSERVCEDHPPACHLRPAMRSPSLASVCWSERARKNKKK
jgi:hypothetical protein